MAESFGDYMRRHRTRLQIKQETLAQTVGISQSYVSGIERGVNREVDPEIVKAIADALGQPRGEALRVAFPKVTPAEIAYELPADLAPIVEGFNGLPEGPAREIVLEQMASVIAAAYRLTGGRGVIGGGNGGGRYSDSQLADDAARVREIKPGEL